MWDSAGQERFRAITRPYYRAAEGALLVYDVSDQNSFTRLKENWIADVRHYGRDGIKLSIVGNKVHFF